VLPPRETDRNIFVAIVAIVAIVASALDRVIGATDPCARIVTDLHMPRLDGEGLLGHVRAVSPGPSIIVLTGTDDGDAEARLMEKGG
jgi:CheY-like chemotaxis protein